MRAKITVTDDHGQNFEAEVDLAPAVRGGKAPRTRPAPTAAADAKVDFGLPRRAFLRRYARGRSGAQKFALLIAHMTEGKTGIPVARADVRREWGLNSGVLGGNFRGMYATRSRENGWTDSAGRGTFVLRGDWHAALRSRG